MSDKFSEEQLDEILRPTREQVAEGSIWRHRKSKGNYVVLGVALAEGDQTPVVVYRLNKFGGIPWVRVARDFLDGRFALVESPGTGDEAPQ